MRLRDMRIAASHSRDDAVLMLTRRLPIAEDRIDHLRARDAEGDREGIDVVYDFPIARAAQLDGINHRFDLKPPRRVVLVAK